MASSSSKASTSKKLAQTVARMAGDKKAQDIVILDMRQMVNFCDFFVIATGTSDRHAQAIAQGIEDELTEQGMKLNLGRGIKPMSGARSSSEHGVWVLLDMVDIVVHIFEPNAREFYALEHLWQDAPQEAYKPKVRKKTT